MGSRQHSYGPTSFRYAPFGTDLAYAATRPWVLIGMTCAKRGPQPWYSSPNTPRGRQGPARIQPAGAAGAAGESDHRSGRAQPVVLWCFVRGLPSSNPSEPPSPTRHHTTRAPSLPLSHASFLSAPSCSPRSTPHSSRSHSSSRSACAGLTLADLDLSDQGEPGLGPRLVHALDG
eukprot:3066891-Rhodomonas_salina.1